MIRKRLHRSILTVNILGDLFFGTFKKIIPFKNLFLSLHCFESEHSTKIKFQSKMDEPGSSCILNTAELTVIAGK